MKARRTLKFFRKREKNRYDVFIIKKNNLFNQFIDHFLITKYILISNNYKYNLHVLFDINIIKFSFINKQIA